MDFLFTVRWEIRKRICKTVLVNSGVLFVNYACACKTAVLSVKIRFRISRSIANPKSGFQNLNPDFPIKGTRTKKLEPIQTNPDILSPFHFLYPDLSGRRLTLLWRAVWKRCGFGERIHWFRVNRRPIQVKKTPGFQKYPGPVNVALAFLAPGSGSWRPISANPGLKFCSVFVFYLPMCCLE